MASIQYIYIYIYIFKFFLLCHGWAMDWALKWHGWMGLDRVGLGVKKICLLNKAGSGNGGGPVGQFRA